MPSNASRKLKLRLAITTMILSIAVVAAAIVKTATSQEPIPTYY